MDDRSPTVTGAGPRSRRRVVSAVALWAATSLGAAGSALLVLPSGAAAQAAAAPSPSVPVVVMAEPGARAAAEQAVVAFGGRVTRDLAVIDGFAATVPADTVAALAASQAVLSVTPDQVVRPQSLVPSLGYDPATDLGSLSQISQAVGAQAAWAAGFTGAGVDVAVIDTGVTRVAGLDAPGKVVNGPDLSFDQGSPALVSLDGFGHGTFMASLIAGRDDAASPSAAGCGTCLNASGYSDTTKFVGIAPDARLINVKVGAADGSADVSQVIAAIDWVTQHAHDPGFNIRVLNLSFGTQSAQTWNIDPLAYAADAAWRHGIVVVASAGNDGAAAVDQNGNAMPLADPAYDPNILAVGSVDLATGTVPAWAQHGTGARPVDLVAPGTHVLGLRVPGSYVDGLPTNTGQVGSRFQRGSGTSESAAIASGLVALLAERYPAASPDQLKALLDKSASTKLPSGVPVTDNGKPVGGQHIAYAGNGLLNLGGALALKLPGGGPGLVAATGTGTLEAARGGVYVADNGVELTGERDIFAKPFTSAATAILETAGISWSGGFWNGSRWSGDSWAAGQWTTVAWTGTDWAGSRWSGSRWSGMTWNGSRWSGTSWTSTGWTGSRWSGSRWSSYQWN